MTPPISTPAQTLRSTRPAGPARIALAAALCAAAGGLVGCDRGAMDRVEENESLLGFLPTAPTPADAARWSQDPYDADKRFRGTNLLMNAPFGGEDVYVQTYRMKLGAPPASEPDPDPGVRGVAARALSLHGAPQDAMLIIPLLNDPDRRTRLEAVRALQRIHNPKAIEPLLLATREQEQEYDVRAEAATALGQYAELRVLQGLVDALDDDYLAVTRAARDSLATLTGEDFNEDQRKWLTWLKDNKTPFAGQREYMYPVFNRDLYWFEHIPLVPQPPNEISAVPVGMGAPVGESAVATGGPAAPSTTSPSTTAATPSAPATATAATVAPTPPATLTTTATTPAVAGTPTEVPAPTGAPTTTAPTQPATAAVAPTPPPTVTLPTPPPPTPATSTTATGPQPRPEPLPETPPGPAVATNPPATPSTPATPATPPAKGPGFTPGQPVTPAPKKP